MIYAVRMLAALAFLSFLSLTAEAAGPVLPGNVTRTILWYEPTTNADGTPLIDLASYRVYWTQNPAEIGTIQPRATVPAPLATPPVSSDITYAVPANTLTPGQWYVAVGAVDTSGNESLRASTAVCTDTVTSCAAPPIDTVAPAGVGNLNVR